MAIRAGSGRMRLLLAFFAMLPVFVMLGWFVSHRGDARGRELEDARQILGMAADRVEASIAPAAPLESVLSEEMSNSYGYDIARVENILRNAFEQVIPGARDPRTVRINLFSESGLPVSWPPDERPEDGSAVWKGLSERLLADRAESPARADPAVLASATAALCRWFGSRASMNELETAALFGLTVPDTRGRPTAVAVYRAALGKIKARYKFGVLIRIPLEAIPPASYHRWAIVSKPSEEDVAGVGILDASGATWLARAGNLPGFALQPLLEHAGRVVPVRGGFALLRDLPPHAPGKLVLFRPESFWAGGGAGFHAAVAMLVALTGVFSWLLAGFLTGSSPSEAEAAQTPGSAIRPAGSLRTRTAVVFLLAGMVPVGFSLMQGVMRLLDLEAVRRVEWQIEAKRVMTALDRGFRDTLERYQEVFTSVARIAAGEPEKVISDIAARTASCTEIIVIEAGGAAPAGSEEITIRSTEGRRLIMSPVVHKAMRGVFEEMRAAAGFSARPGGSSRKEKLALPIHELLGDAIPLKELFNNVGRITYLILAEKTALLFCLPYPLRGEMVAGMLVGGTTLGIDSSEYFNRNTTPERWKYPDWDLFRINRTVVDPKLPVIPREFLRLAVRTQQTGSAVAARVDFPDGPYLVQTSRPSYLHLGILASRVPVRYLKKETAWMFALACAGVLIALAMAVGVGVYLSRRLLEPIRMLQSAAETVGEGVLDVSLSVRGRDELAMLGRSFLEMTDGLRQRERMRRFLSESAWAVTESEGAGETAGGYINAAIICSDIRSFTSISERQPPARVTAMLNEYFTEMDRVIRGFGGEIDKLVGDAVQAVFREGEGIEHPAIRAARAGLAMRRALAALNRVRSLRGEFPVENGVGIHYGKVIAGKVGAAGGRQDFTVIGSAVAFAARLEAASRQGVRTKVIVSAETAALIAGVFACEPLGGIGEETACEIVRDPVGYTEADV